MCYVSRRTFAFVVRVASPPFPEVISKFTIYSVCVSVCTEEMLNAEWYGVCMGVCVGDISARWQFAVKRNRLLSKRFATIFNVGKLIIVKESLFDFLVWYTKCCKQQISFKSLLSTGTCDYTFSYLTRISHFLPFSSALFCVAQDGCRFLNFRRKHHHPISCWALFDVMKFFLPISSNGDMVCHAWVSFFITLPYQIGESVEVHEIDSDTSVGTGQQNQQKIMRLWLSYAAIQKPDHVFIWFGGEMYAVAVHCTPTQTPFHNNNPRNVNPYIVRCVMTKAKHFVIIIFLKMY